MTAEIDTFMSEVSTTRTNIAIARRIISRRFPWVSGAVSSAGLWVMSPFRLPARHQVLLGHHRSRLTGGAVALTSSSARSEFIDANGSRVGESTGPAAAATSAQHRASLPVEDDAEVLGEGGADRVLVGELALVAPPVGRRDETGAAQGDASGRGEHRREA